MKGGKWKSWQQRSSLKNCRGFTLLEVIVALGIVAVGILAVSRAITGFAGTTLSLEQRMVANWIAGNRLETHRIVKTIPVVGTSHGSEEMAGHVWYFSETTTATADPNLFRIDITVFTDKDETEEAGNMYGYLLNQTAINAPVVTSKSLLQSLSGQEIIQPTDISSLMQSSLSETLDKAISGFFLSKEDCHATLAIASYKPLTSISSRHV